MTRPLPHQLAGVIDHTLLRADATQPEIERLCAEARTHRFATVCVNPAWVATAAAALRGSGVGVATVVGFPLGATLVDVKVLEATATAAAGATEIDMVLAIGALKSGLLAFVQADIERVVQAVAPRPVKVILEMALLTQEDKQTAIALSVHGGAAFVKTSTGFGPGGATIADVTLMADRLRALGAAEQVHIKASGGIRTRADAEAMLTAGAHRLGTSASVAILSQGDLAVPPRRAEPDEPPPTARPPRG
jgi:deoxyribose-phosphate aldolase